MNQDREHVRLLAVFHYVVAGLVAIFSLIPVIHLSIGIAMVSGAFPLPKPGEPDVRFIGWFLVAFAAIFIGCGLTLAAFIAIAGRNLWLHRRHLFCLVVAAVSCVFIPFGLVLGVFTIIVLMRPSVRELFGVDRPADAA